MNEKYTMEENSFIYMSYISVSSKVNYIINTNNVRLLDEHSETFDNIILKWKWKLMVLNSIKTKNPIKKVGRRPK